MPSLNTVSEAVHTIHREESHNFDILQIFDKTGEGHYSIDFPGGLRVDFMYKWTKKDSSRQ